LAGQSFQLADHLTPRADALACLCAEHHARNNLDADVQGVIEQALGAAMKTLSPLRRPQSVPLRV